MSHVQLDLSMSPDAMHARIVSQERVITALAGFCFNMAYYLSYWNAVATPYLVKRGKDNDALSKARDEIWSDFVHLQNVYYNEIQRGV